MVRKLKWLMLMLLFTSFILSRSIQAISEEEYLIVRIVDTEYPPSIRISDEGLYTSFEFLMNLQIENPTQSGINITYVCSPVPYPHLRTNLENKSLEIMLSVMIEGTIPHNYTFQPGIVNRTHYFTMVVLSYESEQLPFGEYEIWYDFTNCSYAYSPVVSEKMIIYVTESSVTYFYEFNNESEVVLTKSDLTTPFDQTNLSITYIGISLLLFSALIRKLKHRKKVIDVKTVRIRRKF